VENFVLLGIRKKVATDTATLEVALEEPIGAEALTTNDDMQQRLSHSPTHDAANRNAHG